MYFFYFATWCLNYAFGKNCLTCQSTISQSPSTGLRWGDCQSHSIWFTLSSYFLKGERIILGWTTPKDRNVSSQDKADHLELYCNFFLYWFALDHCPVAWFSHNNCSSEVMADVYSVHDVDRHLSAAECSTFIEIATLLDDISNLVFLCIYF